MRVYKLYLLTYLKLRPSGIPGFGIRGLRFLLLTGALESLADGPLCDSSVCGYRDQHLGMFILRTALLLRPAQLPYTACVLTAGLATDTVTRCGLQLQMSHVNSTLATDTVTRCGLLLQMSHIAWSEPQLPHAASVLTTSLALHSTQHTHSVTFVYNFLLLNKESTSKAHSIVISRPSWKIICSRCQSLISRSRQQH